MENTNTNKRTLKREKNLLAAMYEYLNLNTAKEIKTTVFRNTILNISNLILISNNAELSCPKVK